MARRRDEPISDDAARAALGKYKEFWQLDPRRTREVDILIPDRVKMLGKGVHVLYESGKKDPETLRKPRKPLSYIHEHDAGVAYYTTSEHDQHGLATGRDIDVPSWICEAPALVVLGKCLGFAFKHDGKTIEVEGTRPYPDLCCTIDGRALLVVQGRDVLALGWGGALGVEARGIVG